MILDGWAREKERKQILWTKILLPFLIFLEKQTAPTENKIDIILLPKKIELITEGVKGGGGGNKNAVNKNWSTFPHFLWNQTATKENKINVAQNWKKWTDVECKKKKKKVTINKIL